MDGEDEKAAETFAHAIKLAESAAQALRASYGEEYHPGNVVDLQTRFTRPIPVPAIGEATVSFTAKVGALDPEARTARIDITVENDGQKVLGKAQAVVSCA